MKIVLKVAVFGLGTWFAKLTHATFRPLAKLQMGVLPPEVLDALALDGLPLVPAELVPVLAALPRNDDTVLVALELDAVLLLLTAVLVADEAPVLVAEDLPGALSVLDTTALTALMLLLDPTVELLLLDATAPLTALVLSGDAAAPEDTLLPPLPPSPGPGSLAQDTVAATAAAPSASSTCERPTAPFGHRAEMGLVPDVALS